MEWNNLTSKAKEYINQRFGVYNINGQDAFNDNILFPKELKELESDEIVEILKTKDISHVMPKSQYPELESDINNIVFEDSSINRARGAEMMMDNEIEIAKGDYYNDISQYEDNLAIFDNLPEVLIGSTTIGLGLSSYKAYNKVKNNEILLKEVPRFVIVDAGGKIVKCAIIGVCATSGAPILVAGAFAYTLYKAKNLISTAFKGVWNIVTHPITISAASYSGTASIKILGTGTRMANTVGVATWNVATHDTTKSIAIKTAKTTGMIISESSKGVWKIATHEKTKNIAIGTIKTTGKIVSNTTKGIWNIGKWALKKK